METENKNPGRRNIFTVSVPPELVTATDALCLRLHRSRSNYIKMLISADLEEKNSYSKELI
jgi:metal-responsive CopG/Arc/MetJ family transcriptional regulator